MIDPLKVATEFRFDVGQAILNTKNLQDAVEGLDHSVNQAVSNLTSMATTMITRLGFGAGLLGVLTEAFNLSEQFTQNTLYFSQNITNNMQYLTGTIDTFNDRLETSKMLLGNVAKVARDSGLSNAELGAVVQRVATPLAGQGKLGHNYENAIQLSKNLLLSSAAVGLNPHVAVESLSRALSDKMALHGQLFTRLVGTQAFRDQHIKTQGQLIGMDTGKKIDLLSKALDQLGGSADFIAYRMQLVAVQFKIFKDNIAGILKPIGDSLVAPLKRIFMAVNKWLAIYGPTIGKSIAGTLDRIFDDPKRFLVNIMQLMSFKKDLKRAMSWTSELLLGATILTFFKKTRFIGQAIEGFLGITAGTGFLEILMGEGHWIAKAFQLISSAFAEFLPNVAAFLFFFQIFSRAKAIAHIDDLIHAVAVAPAFIEALVKIKDSLFRIMVPLNMAIDAWANLFAELFRTQILLDMVIWFMQQFANVLSAIADIISWVLRLFKDQITIFQEYLYDQATMNPEIFSNLLDNLKTSWHDFMTLPKAGEMPSPQYTVNNNNHIEARFDMREQLEPDRVAFAVTEHLKKLVVNATQASGSLYSGLSHGHAVEGL